MATAILERQADPALEARGACHLSIQGVTKRFGTGAKEVHAFGPVELTIEAGSFVSLLGPSGCGKSTLLLMLAGLIPPTSGRIEIAGTPVTGVRTDVGIMFQDNTLVPWRTVRGNIALQLELRGLDPARHTRRIDELLAAVALTDFAGRYPYELSGGMQQRAAFCQTMVHAPPTVLLDEPLGKLDAMTRERVRRDLQELWMRSRPTVVLVTHSIEEAVQLSSQVCLITPRPGRVHETIPIDLPWPRDDEVKKSAAFAGYVNVIGDVFRAYGVM
ncbi:ABC transporter ATP-binding protein [Lichenifustis flavocetrariae]|uniref:ABC transporter ATP-binding protein n=1 Tax=Lichenifustis flavocetrariae TaxID=2949735 RepID=A0AA41YVC5_9HYPH|nr:ABC transporter ATP-binding protein [Lichenifustis flavocetrariae]MCW6509246.1 ABC transporter ATP-binding protein [Lichenifustis flavocetrariae]